MKKFVIFFVVIAIILLLLTVGCSSTKKYSNKTSPAFNRNNFEIFLQNNKASFIPIPLYYLLISGDGRVVYKRAIYNQKYGTYKFVTKKTLTISSAKIEQLYLIIKKSNFFSLKTNYPFSEPDIFNTLEISINKKFKRVEYGINSSVPPELVILVNEIREIAEIN